MTKKHPIIIGLTGAVGAGKSTVAKAFGDLGCAVIDADAINHQVLTEPEVIDAIVARFGPTVRNEQGQIDRQVLSEIVFDDPAARKALTDIVHPRILARQDELLSDYRQNPSIPAVVLDVPLLLEVGYSDSAMSLCLWMWTKKSDTNG